MIANIPAPVVPPNIPAPVVPPGANNIVPFERKPPQPGTGSISTVRPSDIAALPQLADVAPKPLPIPWFPFFPQQPSPPEAQPIIGKRYAAGKRGILYKIFL
ncbi:hypothetical protein ACX27_01800 [Nostoc piscinale CENA21]|uniref:Uncharacterized protein n=1 Tax=Nostoc piscinale CENA21 TaxID=224013 RepID=A0A0M4SNG5_9NOSO|nr:hypothetical protein [Nostoc piscinale]ALF51865.1 hypothetical protein ACX27_01800 [Nostoc piscinale CENA21]